MTRFTLEYWDDNDWVVGRLKEMPDVFSQGKNLTELEENILDAYREMHCRDWPTPTGKIKTKEFVIES